MSNLFAPLMTIVCLLFVSCNKDDIFSMSMDWTYDILTPESVKFEAVDLGWKRAYFFSFIYPAFMR